MNTFIEVPASKRSLSKRKPIFGIGINDADYLTYMEIDGEVARCPFYSKWRSMIERCYSKKALKSKPAYIGCYISEEWEVFSNFKSWMELQDWEGKDLDKDILKQGNKLYSADTCIFVSPKINYLLNKQNSSKGSLPTGVCLWKATGKFTARCRIDGNRKNLGYFNNPNEAHKAFIIYKSIHVKKIANTNKDDPKLHKALLRISDLIRKGEYYS